ncbi:MAG: hypothetical protein RRZ42_04160 [Oscillospiraceae bacterium]
MIRFFALIRVSFLALLKSFSFTKKKVSGIGALAFMGALCVYMSGIYSFMFASALKPEGMLDLMPLLMIVVSCFMSLVLTVFAAGGIVFGGKDSDFILALPVSAFEIMLSKIMALYLENLLIVLFMMVPCGAVFMFFDGFFDLGFMIMLIIGTAFISFIPTLLCVVVGFLITWFSGHVKKKALITNVLYLAFIIGIMAISFQIQSLLGGIMQNADGIAFAMNSYLLPFGLFGKACRGDILSLISLIAISVIPFLLVVWLFSKKYKSIITRINTQFSRNDYKMQTVAASSQLKALYIKESNKYFGTPMYLMNTGFGIVMMLGASILALVKKSAISIMLSQIGDMPILPLICAGLMFAVGTVCTTCVSISLEGDRLWILKEAPLKADTIFFAKALFNLSLTVPSIIVSVAMLAFAFSFSAAEIAIAILLPCVFSAFVACFGIVVNLRFPKLDCDNETIVIKQSASSMIGIFGGMLIVIAGSLLYGFFLSLFISFEIFALTAIVLLAALTALIVKSLQMKGAQTFLEL